MRKCLRCCISCILPCGALDVIRIVHSNGRVEEFSGTIKAIDVMKAHPKHVLKKPCSSAAADGCSPGLHKIVVVPPDAELQRGKIYFLMPLPSPSQLEKNHQRRKKKEHRERTRNNTNVSMTTMTTLLLSDRYFTEILSEKLSTQRDKRRGRVAEWRPHLETISESPSHP